MSQEQVAREMVLPLGNTTELVNREVNTPKSPPNNCKSIVQKYKRYLKARVIKMIESEKRDNYVMRDIWQQIIRYVEKHPAQMAQYQKETAKRGKVSFDRDLYCGHSTGSHVDIKITAESNVAVYAHVAYCGATWVCPLCAAKLQARRGAEVVQAVNLLIHQSAVLTGAETLRAGETMMLDQPKKVIMLTLTASHTARMPLADVGAKLSVALRYMQNQRDYKSMMVQAGLYLGEYRLSNGKTRKIKGMIRACEYTYGSNGWHKHFHILLVVNKDTNVGDLQDNIKQMWVNACLATGLCSGTVKDEVALYEHGATITATVDTADSVHIARYAAKCGGGNYAVQEIKSLHRELVSSGTKKGHLVISDVQRDMEHRTPNQIAMDIALYDEEDDIARVRDIHALAAYMYHTHGTSQLHWAGGLKAMCGIVDKRDEDILEDANEGAAVVCGLTVPHWHEVCRRIDQKHLSEIATEQGMTGVQAYFDGLGVGYELPPLLTPDEVRLLDSYESEDGGELSGADADAARALLSKLSELADDAPRDHQGAQPRKTRDVIMTPEELASVAADRYRVAQSTQLAYCEQITRELEDAERARQAKIMCPHVYVSPPDIPDI